PAAGVHHQAAPPLAPSHAPARRTQAPVIEAHAEAQVVATRAADAHVIEAEPAVRASKAEEIDEAAIEAPEIERPVNPAPRPASDPLAPIMALSAEEKIALFT